MAIISFSYKYVFLKTRKVAGTSVEAVLRHFTGPDDIVPAVTPRDEFWSLLEGQFSRNYLKDPAQEQHYTDLVSKKEYEAAADFLKSEKKLASSHMGYKKIKNIISRKGLNIDDFFVFTIERHPYSWMLSKVLYSNERYNLGKSSSLDISKDEINRRMQNFLGKENARELINWPMYTIDNEIKVDKVIRYENLREELDSVLKGIGIEQKYKIPELKTNSRHLDAFDILDFETKSAALDTFKEVFESFGYEK